jgi:hypothetical protein
VKSAQDTDVAITLRLSAQRALLGQVPPVLRALSVAAAEHCIHFRCYFDGPTSDHDKELLSEAATEIIADFSAPWAISEEYLELPYPEPMRHLEHLIYLRHESLPTSTNVA